MKPLPIAFVLCIVALATSPLNAGDTYAEARHSTAATGKPLVVLVGAEWCPACQTMEQNVIPVARKRDVFRRVSFAIVDFDRERDLAAKLTAGGPIPQLIVFRKTESGWRRSVVIGGQTVDQVEAFIESAIRNKAK